MTKQPVLDSPLSDLRVLDLSRVLAGPFVGRMLADLGADVVKVEPPEGDVTRIWGKRIAGLSGYFTQQNVGKRDICVDLRVAGGPELIVELAARADVVVENFRPGVMKQYGLDWETLSARNPRLCMLSISGFGQTGPESRRPAYAAVVHAESGLVHRQAALDGTRPADLRFSIADANAGLHGLVGLLSALMMRSRTGTGQHVDISMLQAMLTTDDYVHLSLDGVTIGEGVVGVDIWDIAGLPIVIAGDLRWIWQRLVATQNLKDPAPEGSEIPVKAKLRREAVQAFFATIADRETMARVLDEADLAYGEVKDTPTALSSPTLKERGAVAEVSDRATGIRRVIQSPYRFSDAQSGARAGAPYRGEHNRDVLRDWLALGDAEVDGLVAKQVLLAETRR